MDNDLSKRIARAKELLNGVRHAAMATVNADGTPHNTPFFFIRDPKLGYIYWGSHPASLHSENVVRTGKIFVVLYDAMERGGLYMSAENGHELKGEELAKALAIHNHLRSKEGKDALTADYYTGNSPQRMWAAKITHFWVNSVELDADGHMVRDGRTEIRSEDLLSDNAG